MTSCKEIVTEHSDMVEEIVAIQLEENREAIFFIYEDGSTSEIFKGEPTQISLTREEEASIMAKGNVVGSVHSHPAGLDPSTIDLITGVASGQQVIGVVTPTVNSDINEEYVLTCFDISSLGELDSLRFMRAMRRSSVSAFEFNRQLRKQWNVNRFDIDVSRTSDVDSDMGMNIEEVDIVDG